MLGENMGIPQVRPGPISWLSKAIRAHLEDAISIYSGTVWRIRDEQDMSEFACHHCAVVSDGSYPVFFKFSQATDAWQQFEVELSGLQTLSRQSGVLTPNPIAIMPVEAGTLLVMQALQAVERCPHQWRQIGKTLARIHQVKGVRFGLNTNGFCGPLLQDNTYSNSWATFYRDLRLLPALGAAVESGHLPLAIARSVESLATRVTDLCGPEPIPTLLHGDAQQNNFISTTTDTFVIDPAIYYGHPEMDLALVDSFQPVPDIVFDAYREEMPIDPGFGDRRDLWRLPLYLVSVAVEGPVHLNRLSDALRKYMIEA